MRGWLAIAGVVVGFDVWACRRERDTLSCAFRRAPRALTITTSAYVLAHLFGLMPDRVDPLVRLGAALTPTNGAEVA